jgi:hypothetical protein
MLEISAALCFFFAELCGKKLNRRESQSLLRKEPQRQIIYVNSLTLFLGQYFGQYQF